MFIYEKNGKLNIAFQSTQIPPETPDYVIEKDFMTIGGTKVPADQTQNNQRPNTEPSDG